MIIFSTENNKPQAKALSEMLGAELGVIQSKRFPDGEEYLRVLSDVEDKDVLLVGSTKSSDDALFIHDLGTHVTAAGAKTLTIVVPYFGYSAMERATKSGEVIRARARAELLDKIPAAKRGQNNIVILDAHSPVIKTFFKNTECVLCESAIELTEIVANKENAVLVSPDRGRVEFVKKLSSLANKEYVVMEKKRYDELNVKVSVIDKDLTGRAAFICDDMVRSGKTLLAAAAACRDKGAKEVHAIVTHFLSSHVDTEALLASGLFNSITVSDSVTGKNDFYGSSEIQVFNCAPSLLRGIREVVYDY